MVLLHPDRVAAAWLRSGVPLLQAGPKPSPIKPHEAPDAALRVPVMCNLGTKEGVTEKTGRFAGGWPNNETFFNALRARGALLGVSIDPFTAHECGNQRYLAILWLDACLTARLPEKPGAPLREMPEAEAQLAPLYLGAGDVVAPVPAAQFTGDKAKAVWLPNAAVGQAWAQYVKDTAIPDTTPPPAPTNLHVQNNVLTWEAEADLESGLAGFIIERDGVEIAKLPEQPKNPFGRPVFQGLQYSDTPSLPLVPMTFTDTTAEPGKPHQYRIIAVNTVGLKSK
jgi:hypothetical protein